MKKSRGDKGEFLDEFNSIQIQSENGIIQQFQACWKILRLQSRLHLITKKIAFLYIDRSHNSLLATQSQTS